jgi:hypothetical protein
MDIGLGFDLAGSFCVQGGRSSNILYAIMTYYSTFQPGQAGSKKA